VRPEACGFRLPVRTARLFARDFVASDFDAVHAYASDPDVTRFMFFAPRTPEETRAYLERMAAAARQEPRTVWELAVIRAADGRLIGGCDLTLEQPHEADLGFIFARDVWGHGYASEIARALVRAGFEALGVVRVFATCDVDNHASARVLERAGLRREARLDRHKFARDRWWTSFLYGLRRDDWLASRVVYRQATVGDVPEMARSRASDAAAGVADPRMAAYLHGRHDPQHARAPRAGFVAVERDRIVGYIAGHLTRRYDCDGELQYLFVAAECRRRGIASELLACLFGWFREQGASRICVDVLPENGVARAFYGRYGAITLNRGWLVFPEV
jgi:[ribosomal protein S5]-alanine N-acetyltransferase